MEHDLKAWVLRINALLIQAYGDHPWIPRHDPMGELIGTILSQHTADVNSIPAYENLIRLYPRWSAVRDASEEDIALAVRRAGLARSKAHAIKKVLVCLTPPDGGEPIVDQVCAMPDLEEARRLLLALPGV